ncbi:MAG: pore-forming ESAT-6 family protein, partial [Chloroflexota bacterium]
MDRISYDTSVSSSVQSDIQSTIGQLESLIAEREKAVAAAMADYQADGVSDEYQVVENRWKSAAGEVKNIIALVRQTLDLNDQTAASAGQKART